MPAFFGLSLGLLLTATAGWVDAIGFLRLGGLYPSFMSGNTTQLGVALSHDDWHLVEMAATILGLFFVGGFCGGLAAALPSSWRLPAVLTLETALLASAICLAVGYGREHGAVLLLPVAMGVQNAASQELRQSGSGTTFVTGTLFRAAHELGRAVVGRAGAAWFPQFLAWTSFAVGAGAGALGNVRWGILALSVPLAVVATVTMVAVVFPHRTDEVGQ